MVIVDKDLKVVKDTYDLDEGKNGCIGKCHPLYERRATSHYDKTNHYIEVTSPITERGGDQVAGVILASVSTDGIEVTRQVLYTHGGVSVGILMALLAMFSVFLANRMVLPPSQDHRSD